MNSVTSNAVAEALKYLSFHKGIDIHYMNFKQEYGVMSSPIYFNQAGHAPNSKTAQLRFQRTSDNDMQQAIQIYFDVINTPTSSIEVNAYKIA